MQSSKGTQPASRISKATSQRLERQKTVQQTATKGISLEDAPDLKPKSTGTIPRARDPSPSKLPVGSLKRPSGLRPPSATSGKADGTVLASAPAHKRQLSANTFTVPKVKASSSQAAQATAPKAAQAPPAPKDKGGPSKPGVTRRVTPSSREVPPTRTLSRTTSDSRPTPGTKPSAQPSVPKQTAVEAKKPPPKPRETSLGSSQASTAGGKSVAALTASFQQEDVPKSLVESSLELLQLHAIHSKSARTQREWKESARKYYEAQFNDVVAFRAALNAREKDLLLQRNASAVIDWGSCAGDTLERRLQVLSTTLDEAWQLSGPDGRYTLIIQAFEDWYATVEASRERQASGVQEHGLTSLAAEGLGDGWKVEVESLQESLLEAANAILSLGDLEGESDLARTIALLLELIKNMLDELELIESIEQSLVAQQQSWVQDSLKTLNKAMQ